MLKNVRILSVAEAVSYLALLGAAFVKRSGGGEAGVTYLGPVHGLLFLAFVVGLFAVYGEYRWPFWRVVAAAFIGSLPFGGFWLERKWLTDEAAEALAKPAADT